jgi:hypothetical protein
MESNFHLIIILIIFIVVVFISYYFSKRAVIRRKLKTAEYKRISHFVNGETAKIIGKVEMVDPPLKAPLSGRRCAHYYIHIEEKSGKSWKTLIEEEVSCKFVIRDGDTYAFINDTNLSTYIVQDREYSSGFLNDATPALEEYLNTHGYKSENILGLNNTLRYKEGILEEGEEIAVLGRGEWKTAKQMRLPEVYERILVMSSPDFDGVVISDDPDAVENKK